MAETNTSGQIKKNISINNFLNSLNRNTNNFSQVNKDYLVCDC